MLFRNKITIDMDKYGLIGYPLGHSFSISYFNEKFENENIDAEYINFEIPSIDALPEILASNPELRGLNVTIPYKEKVISFLDSVSPEARTIGAVNVIRVEHKGNETKLKGYNSDVIGFTRSIEPLLERFHKKALILGTGGASKAINYGLKSLGLETVFVSRYIAEFFSSKGCEVYVLNRNTREQSQGVNLIQADRHHLGETLRDFYFDIIIDTAYSADDVNMLLDAVGGYKDYILISSSAVYPEYSPGSSETFS